jgi:membrane protease YdiL (CAAX protease family)
MTTQSVDYKTKAFEPRNLAFFFLIVFGLTILKYGLLLSGIVKMPSGEGLSALSAGPGILLIVLGAWGPIIAALTVTAITEGKSGIRALWGRFWNRNMSIKWLLVTILFYPVVMLIANLISRMLDAQDYPLLALPTPAWTAITAFITAFIFNGMFEEFGWRGYVLPRFQAKWNALTSSLILGVIWVSWHIGEFFLPGSNLYQKNFLEWALSLIVVSIVYTWIFNNTKGSVLSAALLHAAANASIIWAMLDWRFVGVQLLAAVLILIVFGPENLVRPKADGGT